MQPAPRARLTAAEPDVGPGGLTELWTHRRLLWAFVVNDLKNRYVGSSIGFFWTVITPLLELITYTFVFHVLLAVKFHPAGGSTHYALFLFCGMVVWYAVGDGITRAASVVRESAQLIKKVNFPSVVLPGHVVVSAVLNQCIRLSVLMVAALVVGHGLSWHILLVPFVIVAQAVFTLGLGMLVACSSVYFRGTIHWVNAGLMLWMFVTPIFYPAAVYPKRFILLLQLNPLAHLVGVYQELILNHRLPHAHSSLVAVVMALFSMLVGYSVFHRYKDKFSDLV